MSADPAMAGSGKQRLPRDAYDTIEAEWLIPALLRHVTLRGTVWEPSAGSGHLVRELTAAGHRVIATDIEPRAPGIGRADFLGLQSMPTATESIVMNPPYSDIDAHIEHALKLAHSVSGQVAVLARAELSAAGKRVGLFRDCRAFDMRIELTRRPRWFSDGHTTPRHNYA